MPVIGFAVFVLMALAIGCGEPDRTTASTAAPTTKPTATPASTPTPTEAEKLIVFFGGQIDDKVQERSSSCYVGMDIDGTITMFSSRSISYLRTYLTSPNLSESNVQSIINYLESQRGRHERICHQERGRKVPEAKDVSDIIEFYDTGLAQRIREGKNCEVAERFEELSVLYFRENINYLREILDSLWFDRDDLLQLVAHFESEAGRYAALCDKKN